MRTILFLLLFSSACYAAPVITSVTQTDSTITINGTGFGTRGDYGGSKTYLCKRYHNFENNINDDSFFSIFSGISASWVLQNSGSYDNSKWGKRVYAGNRNASLNYTMSSSDTTGVYYVNFRYKQDYGLEPIDTGTNGNQWNKIFRVFSNTVVSGTNLKNYVFVSNILSAGGAINQTIEFVLPSVQYSGINDYISRSSGWHQIEILIEAASDRARVWKDGILSIDSNNDNDAWDFTPFDTNGKTFDIGSQLGYGSGANYQGYDDYVIDYSVARVYLCSSSVSSFSSRGVTQLQIPTSWSNTQIVCNKILGQFSTGQSTKLIIIDNSGVESNAYSVTLSTGGGGDSTKPTLQSISPANGTTNIAAD